MFCRNCGSKLDDNAVFCPHCGTPTLTNNTNNPNNAANAANNAGAPNYGAQGQPQYQQYQQQPQYQPYQQYQPNSAPVTPKRTNGFGIAGFVLGLLAFYGGVYFCIIPLVGLALSIVGVAKMRNYQSCNGLAIAGLVCSIIATLFWGFIFLIIFGIGLGGYYPY